MSFTPGDTFLQLGARGLPAHLWVVISDAIRPGEGVAIVNFTTWDPDKDPSCRLDRGDHPFIEHATCVSYRDARIVAMDVLNSLEQQVSIVRKSPVSDRILGRIRVGAASSPFLPIKIRQLLMDQNLI